MKIITISREFGSGGRELGRQLASHLGFDYFDERILADIAANQGLDQDFVKSYYDHPNHRSIPLTRFNTFAGISTLVQHTEILLEQKRVIENIPQHYPDCVIVGRNADFLLNHLSPFSIFVCADMATKIRRCLERQNPEEPMTAKEIEHKIHQVDKARRQTCDLVTGMTWGAPENYHLMVNTSDWIISELIQPVANFARKWFDKVP